MKLEEIQKKCEILNWEAEQIRANFKVQNLDLDLQEQKLISVFFFTQLTCGMEDHLERTNTFTLQLKKIYTANLKHSKFVDSTRDTQSAVHTMKLYVTLI